MGALRARARRTMFIFHGRFGGSCVAGLSGLFAFNVLKFTKLSDVSALGVVLFIEPFPGDHWRAGEAPRRLALANDRFSRGALDFAY